MCWSTAASVNMQSRLRQLRRSLAQAKELVEMFRAPKTRRRSVGSMRVGWRRRKRAVEAVAGYSTVDADRVCHASVTDAWYESWVCVGDGATGQAACYLMQRAWRRQDGGGGGRGGLSVFWCLGPLIPRSWARNVQTVEVLERWAGGDR